MSYLKLFALLFVVAFQVTCYVNGKSLEKHRSLNTKSKRAGNPNGPVLFPGEPRPTPTTTPRVFLYNTTAPPVDNHTDAKRRNENVVHDRKGKKNKKHHSS